MKQCPFCAEDIKDAAIVCRYCRRDLPAAPPPVRQEAGTQPETPTKPPQSQLPAPPALPEPTFRSRSEPSPLPPPTASPTPGPPASSLSSSHEQERPAQAEAHRNAGEAFSLLTGKGRYTRAKFFWNMVVINIGLVIIGLLIGIGMGASGVTEDDEMFQVLDSCIFGIGVLAVAFQIIKRLQDLDRPAWHYLLIWVPFYNIYLAIVLFFVKGTQGPNKYGPDPLARS